MPRAAPPPSGWFAVGFTTASWLAGALFLGWSGALVTLRSMALQGIVLALLAAEMLLVGTFPATREWARAVDVRVLVALHLTRFVGVYFLYLEAQDRLPAAWAIPAGWGDIVVAVAAVGLLVWGAPDTPPRRRAYLLWNVVGLADIAYVVASAARITRWDPLGMQPLTYLPLSLLPTFVVPVVIGTHLWLFVRLRAAART
jgi:hypothetical protein